MTFLQSNIHSSSMLSAGVPIVLVAENASVARLDRGLGDFVDGKSV